MMLLFDKRQSLSPAGLFYPLFALFFCRVGTIIIHSISVRIMKKRKKRALSLFKGRTARGLAVFSSDYSRKLEITTTTTGLYSTDIHH